jgi:hypothetical protein
MSFRAGRLEYCWLLCERIDALSRFCGGLLDDYEFGESGHNEGARARARTARDLFSKLVASGANTKQKTIANDVPFKEAACVVNVRGPLARASLFLRHNCKSSRWR